MVIKVEVFTSPTCPHCPAAISVVDQAKEKLGDAIEVRKINVMDPEGNKLARDYQIMAVPAIAIDNEVAFVGAPSLEDLMVKLE